LSCERFVQYLNGVFADTPSFFGAVMTARIIDGKSLSMTLRKAFRQRVNKLVDQGVIPGLAVIRVGDDPASKIYVGNKIKACEECGVVSFQETLAADASEADIISHIQKFNIDPTIHGILVQLPLPGHINVRHVIETISVNKDVDGFHLYNVGGLVVGNTIFPPCTPYGVQLLLETTGIEVTGKNVVIVGASNIVGKPMALMLLQKEATVTICHAKTRDIAQHTILADILIVAAGKPGLIVPQMVKEGAIVIDVGINRLPNGQIVGDVDFAGVREKASWITPVPGGVGPMTVTMLIENTLRSAERAHHLRNDNDYQDWETPSVKVG
jgi:methylenetetrahydrofolate dehydrogenase (NADP+) / methenyltetrahydrofolate cyclohydrolase